MGKTGLLIAYAFLIGLNSFVPVMAGSPGLAAKSPVKDTVVVLHGLGRTELAVWLLVRRLRAGGFEVSTVGYRSLIDRPSTILSRVETKLGNCCLNRPGKIHFVGHSLGGIIIRAYLAEHRPENLGRVVLLGTPNGGSEIVDQFSDQWWFKLMGPTVLKLGTSADSFPNSLQAADYPLGVIAGRFWAGPGQNILPGDDDGLVTVDSTRLHGMSDFIVVRSSHGGLRVKGSVARQVLHFLRNGRFNHQNTNVESEVPRLRPADN